jgi:uncharacterized protein involved in outer membrane biogenesis/Flp pilus assembly protein TadD
VRARVRSVRIEFALDALMRGGLRAANVTVQGPELAFGLDKSGRLDWPAPAISFDPDTVSIDHIAIEDGQVDLADAASGTRMTLEKLGFSGDVRSLAGPIRGEGSVVIAGQSYPYRVAASHPAADGAVKLRLNVDPVDHPRMVDLDSSIWLERGVPHFDGTLAWARGFGRASAGDPWRLTGHLRGSTTAAAMEKVELQYGPEDRAARLHGDANLTLGAKPELSATLTATQIDLDRVLGLPEAVRRKPLVALRNLGDRLSGMQQAPIAVRLALNAESVTLAGAPVQRLSGEVRGEAGAWSLEGLDLRAPGATQMRLRGRLNVTAQGVDFAGPGRIESRDPRALVAWLTDRSDVQAMAGPFRAEGDVRVGTEAIAIERLKADLDRMSIEGRFAYTWPVGDRPARIEAALSAPEVDFDRGYALVQDMFAGTLAGPALEWPREGTLALDIARSSIAGVAVQRADIKLRLDTRALDIERLAIADFGGASVAGRGSIDLGTRTPRGTVALDLDVRAPDGVIALLDKFAPQAAVGLRRSAGKFLPAKLQASLALDADAARDAGTPAGAKLKLGGSAGGFTLDLRGDAGMADSASFTDPAKLGAAKLDLTGRLEAQDGGALIELMGLDRLVVVGKGPSGLDLKATGTVDGALAVDGRITAAGLDASAKGSLRLPVGRAAAAGLAVTLAKGELRTVAGVTVPAAVSAQLDLADDTVRLSELAGQVAGSDIGGRLAVGLSEPTTLDGDIRIGKADLPTLIAATVGMPRRNVDATPAGNAPPAGGAWPAEPFGAGLFANSRGKIAVAAGTTTLTQRLTARDLHGTLQVEPSKVTFADVDGALAGGKISGRLVFERGPDGLTASSRMRLQNVDIAGLLPGDRTVSGRLTLDAEIEGSGRSPVALMNSWRGNGTFAAENVGIARLNSGAFDAVIRSVDGGLPIAVQPLRERVDTALAQGAFAIPRAQGTITATGGTARLVDTVQGRGAELTLSAVVDLGAALIDATLTLKGPGSLAPPDLGRPEITIALQGPADNPARTLDVAALTNWLSMRQIAQNAKRLEAAEAARQSPGPPARPPQVRPDGQARLEPQVRVEPQAKVEPQPQAKVEPQGRIEPQARLEPPARVEPQAKVEPPPPARVEPQARIEAQPQVKVEPQARLEPPTRVEPQARIEPQPQVKVEPQARLEPPARVEPQAKVEPPPPARGEPQPPPPPRIEPQAKIETPPPRPEPQAQPRESPVPPRQGETVATATPADDPALKNLDQAVAANPNDANALSRRGQLFVLRGNFPFAIRDFDEVLRIRPKDPEALNNRCWARAILGDLQSALRDCNDALAIRPRYADALDSRGFVNFKIGQLSSAVADYDAALRINPKQASSLYGRGMAKLRTGNASDGQRDIAAAKALQANIADEFANLGIR